MATALDDSPIICWDVPIWNRWERLEMPEGLNLPSILYAYEWDDSLYDKHRKIWEDLQVNTMCPACLEFHELNVTLTIEAEADGEQYEVLLCESVQKYWLERL